MASSSSEGSPQKEKEQTTGESIKDTIESILIAFVLAFVFRAFIVEAFVIPTGSMATTLLGAHMRFLCDDCGQRFTVNYRDRDKGREGDDSNPPKQIPGTKVECDNCGRVMQPQDGVPIYFGDRILVLKYMYLLEQPQRWDVVVFKSPVEPQKNDYSQNYIKRLVGRPGEELMILDGDIYVWQPADGKASNTSDSGNGRWQVQTKPRINQDALWRVVYNNDYQPGHAGAAVADGSSGGRPTGPPQWAQPWQHPWPGGWVTTGGGRVFEFKGGDQASLVFNKQANPQRAWQPFTDFLAYDYECQERGNRHPVSDAKVSFYYERQSGDGKLRVSLSKLSDVFTAELSRDEVRLLRSTGPIRPEPDPQLGLVDPQPLTAGSTLIRKAPLPATNEPLRIDLINVDYQVTVRINGVDVIQTTPDEYSPNVDELIKRHKEELLGDSRSYTMWPRPEVWLSAEQHTCRISHLSLWRDIYYTGYGTYRGREPHPWATPENTVKLARRSDYSGVTNLSPEILGLTVQNAPQGVQVNRVQRGSPAYVAQRTNWRASGDSQLGERLSPGSTITAIGDAKVASVEELAAALKKYDVNTSVQLRARLARAIPGDGQEVTFLIPPLSAGDDEYFVCGDNSILSLDARLWGDAWRIDLLKNENLFIDSGRVPGRFMIGKAFFVYWPAGYRPMSNDLPGIIPNFGEMRFIH